MGDQLDHLIGFDLHRHKRSLVNQLHEADDDAVIRLRMPKAEICSDDINLCGFK